MCTEELLNIYDKVKERSIFHRRIKHKELQKLLQRKSSLFDVKEVGKSFEGRQIYMLRAGTGTTKVMLWSQMHGNEPTATQALFDIFNFFENPGNLHKQINSILQSCTLYFIPMLNPDGCERFQRRNAQDIDINRDALRLESPEGSLLMNLRDAIKPDFGFNLHDQDIWYTAGDTKHPATLSFLAPAFDKEKSLNESRKKSMQLIAEMYEILQKIIPEQIGRYSDDFMPTAFGDNIQQRGTSTILIESGGFADDPEKQTVRKLNFIAILSALQSISKKSYAEKKCTDYALIPFNKKNKLFDYILRNATILKNRKSFLADIGIRSKALQDKDIFTIEDIGDLSANFAYREKDISGTNLSVSLNEHAEELISRFFPE